MDNPVLWIIVAIVVILIIVAIVAMLNGKKKKEQQRQEAAQLREQAAAQELQVKQREQEAEQAAQEAARRRAEADRAAAEARQAEQAASQKQAGAQSVRGEYDDQHRQADLIDPDVDTDKDGFRTDGSRPGGDDGQHRDHGRGGAPPVSGGIPRGAHIGHGQHRIADVGGEIDALVEGAAAAEGVGSATEWRGDVAAQDRLAVPGPSPEVEAERRRVLRRGRR